MRARIAAASLLAVLAAAACAAAPEEPARAEMPAPAPAADAPPPAVEAARPALEPTACRFLVPRSAEGKTVRCADLSVPENRRVPDSRRIKLHVAIVTGAPSGVPTIELNGGPGGGADMVVGPLAAEDPKMTEAYGRILAQGDLVLFDQRGTGRSVPRLSCTKEMFDSPGSSIGACAQRLTAEGIDVAAYDTQENAADVHDLKQALGVPQVNLHGISYGTRLGLEVTKRHPADVRAAIFDGVMPPDVVLAGAFESAVDRILTQVFAACAADPSCDARHPGLEDKLARLQEKLTTAPFEVEDPFYGPMRYDWSAFVQDLTSKLYVEGEAGRLPFTIDHLLAQDAAGFQATRDAEMRALMTADAADQEAAAKDPLRKELMDRYASMTDEDYDASGMATGMYLSVTCNDYLQHETVASARAATAGVRPSLLDAHGFGAELESCTGWPVRPSDGDTRKASTFAGAVLDVGGALDPATPGTWAEHVAATLPNELLVLVPTGGHGLMDACGAELKGAFLATPAASHDTTCATSRKLVFVEGITATKSATSPGVPPGARLPFRPARTALERIDQRVAAAVVATTGRVHLPSVLRTAARVKAVALREPFLRAR